jgi:putative transposase
MDEDHLLAALRYVALDPVKAGLARRLEAWPWSSAGALLTGRSTPHVDVAPALARIPEPAAFLASDDGAEGLWRSLLAAEAVGRQLGAPHWVAALEARHGVRLLTPKKRGPPPREGRRSVATGRASAVSGVWGGSYHACDLKSQIHRSLTST